jgi:hypothetical protein
VNRRLSALLLSGLGAAALFAAPNSRQGEAAAVDAAAVDRYIAHLTETVPRPPEATLAKQPSEDPKVAKSAARLDRAEPIVGAVFAVAR